MSQNVILRLILLFLGVQLAVAFPAVSVDAQQQAAAPADTIYHAWPRQVVAEGYTLVVYQPQLDSWEDNQLKEYAAFSVQSDTTKPPQFGVFYVQARTEVDKGTRSVYLEDVTINEVKFPVSPTDAGTYQELIQNQVADTIRVVSLDRLEAQVAIQQKRDTTRQAEFKNSPPHIIVSETSALLVLVDSTPIYRAVQGTDYDRLLNTSVLVLRAKNGTLYLHVFDGWMETAGLDGLWIVASNPPSDLAAAEKKVLDTGHVDLLDGQADTAHDSVPATAADSSQTKPPSLKTDTPRIYVATSPTALLVFDGAPDYVPIGGTGLLYAKNTTANVFQDVDDGDTYVLLTGRWFKGSSLKGPWSFVAGDQLPPDFANIPDTSYKENVKASIPGTIQAQEAVIENNIPQTATVHDTLTPKPPKYDGTPKLEPIEGTSLSYVVNSASPVILTGPDQYYMLQNGVWFFSQSVNGPWKVTGTVPDEIYSIPPSSSLYYATYVQVYGTGPGVVYLGYTPGYYSVYTYNGVVVYGTGYSYSPWIGTVYYGYPVTYGMGASVTYTPYSGWAVAFGVGMMWGASACCWHYGPYPWYGPVGYGYHYGPYGAAVGYRGYGAYGPGGWAATTGNVYSHWGATSAVSRSSRGYNAWTGNAWAGQSGRTYNSMTGTSAAGQRGGVHNVYNGNYAYGGRGAATNPYTGAKAHGEHATVGNAYTGNSASEFHGSYYNPKTGNYQSAGAVHSNATGNSAARVGNNVYADHDGNVYQNNGGSWQQHDPSSGGWNNVNNASRTSSLNAEQGARSNGNFRSSGYGGFDRGGAGGGGFRGGGGMRGGFRR